MLKLLRHTLYLAITLCVIIVCCYLWINRRASNHLYDEISSLPHKRIAVVLGTSKHLSSGKKNEFYQHRIQAAAELFQANKVDYFIVSGDNRKVNYNEPKIMKEDLVAAGIPSDRIQPDYAGFRTLDSILRMEKVFGHNDYIIISQRFHNQRALYLAHAHGQKAIAYNADNPKTQSTKKVIAREFLARVKAVMDVATNKQAKFYGDKIEFPPATIDQVTEKISPPQS